MRKIKNKLLIISFAGGEKQIVESGYILTKDKTNFVRNSNIKTFGWQLELFFFIAEKEKEGCIITAVYEINADGSIPKVGFRNSPDFKKIEKWVKKG
jgi:hypothetical protein